MDSDAVDWQGLNRANWDDRVPVHLASEFYDLDYFDDQPQVEDFPYTYTDFDTFRRFQALEDRGGRYRFPAGRPRVPLLYSLRATR